MGGEAVRRMGIEAERRLVALASNQLEVVTARNVAASGVPRTLLCRRLRTGEWIRLHRGVFKMGSSHATVDELEMAAILAAGNGAVLSHRSAAARLGLDVSRNPSVQITIPVSRRAPRLV